MTALNSTDYYGSYTDDDSGIGTDGNYSVSNGTYSPRGTFIEHSPSYVSQATTTSSFPMSQTTPIASTATTMEKRSYVKPTIAFSPDGIIERVRPTTMRNSENGDFILCQTDRGAYIAYRTTIVPQWVKQLVEEIESIQR